MGSRDGPSGRYGGGGGGGDAQRRRRRPSGPGGDALILWRVDPTGQFWRTDASGAGGGGTRAESELLRRVRIWAGRRGRGAATTSEGGWGGGGDDDDDQRRNDADGGSAVDDYFAVDNADVRAYLGTLSPSEAVEVATDCLVNGIIAGSGKRRRRLRRDAMHAEDGDGHQMSERRRLSYELGLRRRVRAVIIQS